jgi:hypothetical protein
VRQSPPAWSPDYFNDKKLGKRTWRENETINNAQHDFVTVEVGRHTLSVEYLFRVCILNEKTDTLDTLATALETDKQPA